MSMCPFIQAFVEKNTLIPTGYNTDEKTHTQYEKISHVLSMFFNSGTSFATTSIPFTLLVFKHQNKVSVATKTP